MNPSQNFPIKPTLESAARKPLEPEVQKLIEGCQGLVRSLAWKVHRKLPPHVDLDDLIAFGQLGLVQSARDFDPKKGGKFITYAYYRVRGAIFDGLSKMNWFNRQHYHSSRYEHMANELLRMEQLEEQSGVPAAGTLETELRWLKGASSNLAVVYLASGGDRDEESGQAAIVDASAPSPPAQAAASEMEKILRQLIDALPSDAGGLIRGVYFEGLTLQEAGARLGISKAWASRLHAKTLQRLAHSLRLIGVED